MEYYHILSAIFHLNHNFDSDSDPTFVFDPSPVLNVSLALNCDLVPVLDTRPAFNSDSATSYSSDLDEAGGKHFLYLLYFDPDYALNSGADLTLNFDPGLFSISDPVLALDSVPCHVFNFNTTTNISLKVQ
ncbi:hypothetical protein EVAR_54230_1 [Eumeta japonica]|uniref:Uncharacterized protein n=1 Tax=Eumeta variegata TaxID=151549 RepID=A0A4C1Z2F5_EUMVA|nr:hypothetical protein EVAR_54230_1 [Eumeta japonica]